MTDETPHDDIQTLADDILADSEYDVELGKRMATDARRVADGDLSREAFEETYKDAVEAEFDADLTETHLADSPRALAEPGAVPRRKVLKALGITAAGAVVVGAGTSVDTGSAQSGGSSVQRGMVIDTESCIKCLQCVQACKEENYTPEGHFWMEVHRYQREDREYDGPTDCEPLQRPCQHCDDAPCIEVCPNNSRFKTDEGQTVCDYNTCLGCKYCEVACPYHVNSFVYTEVPEYLDGEFDAQQENDDGKWIAGTPPQGSCSKCTFCVHREWDDDQRGTTACEDVCPVDAIHFGDMNDPESAPNQYLEENEDMNRFKIRDDVADPNVTYLGDDPSEVELEAVPGPTTHEDMDLEDPDPTH